MDRNVNVSKKRSSKELMISELPGTTVVNHVLETLERKSSNSSQESGRTFKKDKKSEVLENAKKLVSLLKKEQDASNTSSENVPDNRDICSERNFADEEMIEVVADIDEMSPESSYAWFRLNLPNMQEFKHSVDSDDDLKKNLLKQKILDFSDTSDSSDSSDTSDSSDSYDELLETFPIIASGFMQNDNDCSNSSSVNDEKNSNSLDSSEFKNSSNFANDDSSNFTDVQNEQCFSISTRKTKLDCEDSDTLQISLPLKKVRRISVISDESSKDLNEEFVSGYSASHTNSKKLSSEKKTTTNFALTESLNYSFNNNSKQNGVLNSEHKYFIEHNSDSSSKDDACILEDNCVTENAKGEKRKLICLTKE